ncbi:MAG: stage II sporulation protein M [Janthinobacterium lividum]
MGLLYRQVASDLSAVRSDSSARALGEQLNRLVSGAHHFVYTGQRTTLRGAFRFLLLQYPVIFRRTQGYVSASLLLCLSGALLGTLLTLARPDFMRMYLGPHMVSTIEHHKMWTDSVVSMEPAASASIMTNNLTVTFATFAGGITAGLLTVYLLFENGLLLGVIGTACAQHGMGLALWSFVAAHGSLELPAIVLAGAAGLRIAGGIVVPGLLRRREALVLAAMEAVQLLAGTIPMLVVAGIIEGFLSPSSAPRAIKFGVCAVLLTLQWVWLFRPAGLWPKPNPTDLPATEN